MALADLFISQLGRPCGLLPDKVLPLTSCDFCSQILSVYERSIEVFLFFLVVFTSESGTLLTYMKNIHFSSSLERPMETSWRNTASRHRDNVHVYDK